LTSKPDYDTPEAAALRAERDAKKSGSSRGNSRGGNRNTQAGGSRGQRNRVTGQYRNKQDAQHQALTAYECMYCGKSGTHPPGLCPEQYKKQTEQEQKRYDDRLQAEAEQRKEHRKTTEQLQQTIDIISQQNQANLSITQNVTAMLGTITA